MKKFNKKSLGQNFLFDKNIINKIVNLVEIKNKNIIRLVPRRSLTDEIIKRGPKSIHCIEKDNFLHKKLNIKYSEKKNLKNINADILKFD